MESSALVYVTLIIVTVFLACFIRNENYVQAHINGYRPIGQTPGYNRTQARNLVAEFAIYCLLMGVSACRIAVGNDYWVYRDNFKLIAQERYVSYEAGFNLVVKWMQQLFGYDNYLPVFGLFSIVTVFFFVKALHDQASDYTMSLYLLLTGGFYFNSLNSVRYYFALAIALYAMKYVLRGDYGKFILWIAFGAFFHKSILLVIPIYLVARFLASVRLKKWHYAVGTILALSLIFGQNIYREIIFFFYPFYRDSAFDDGQISYANIGKCLAVLVLCLICYRRSLKDDLMNRFYFFLNLAATLVYCCGSFIPEVSRVGYYMIVAQIFLIPRLLRDMEKGWFRSFCYVGVYGAFGAYFVLLLREMYDVSVRLLPYLNWIFN
uniref:EpsG family protein n=1 Tax=Acetatifactor sp. TaxID=1872090 RepID=UPI004055B8CE